MLLYSENEAGKRTKNKYQSRTINRGSKYTKSGELETQLTAEINSSENPENPENPEKPYLKITEIKNQTLKYDEEKS